MMRILPIVIVEMIDENGALLRRLDRALPLELGVPTHFLAGPVPLPHGFRRAIDGFDRPRPTAL